MRKALIVGINHYNLGGNLYGCVSDALSLEDLLKRHGDGRVNFDCRTLTATDVSNLIERDTLKDEIESLFSESCEIALFYFAGHGHFEASGGYLLASDAKRGDNGISLHEILTYANKSPATNKIIILDSCHSGIAGESPIAGEHSILSEGLTILTASTKEQYASEEDDRGVFTTLLTDALSGGAANIIGDITPGSVYAHIDQSLGAWEQRPVFKTNVKNFVSLRSVPSSIPLDELRMITTFFPTRDFEFKLDPTYEPEERGRSKGMPPPNPKHVTIFGILQKYNRLHLLVPHEAPHMWHAAMESKGCKLTALGEHYHRLVKKHRI